MLLSKEAIKQVKLLQSFCSKDHHFEQLNNFYYDNSEERFVATDGRAMITIHKSRIADVTETGFYKLDGNELVKADCERQFPNWKRVVPDYKGSTCIKHLVSIKKDLMCLGQLHAEIILNFNIWLNIEYLKKVPEGIYDFYRAKDDAMKAVVLQPCPSVEIIIAPMNHQDTYLTV